MPPQTDSPFLLAGEPVCRLDVDNAGSGWKLVMQSGVGLACTVGIPLQRLLLDECAVPQALYARIDVLILNGQPVDQPASAVIPDQSRLALAAGLPGVAGIAMKSNSAVRGLRPGITHGYAPEESPAQGARPGHIELALFSLAQPLLAAHFLARGVTLPASKLVTYLRDSLSGACSLDGKALSLAAVKKSIGALPGEALVLLRAAIAG